MVLRSIIIVRWSWLHWASRWCGHVFLLSGPLLFPKLIDGPGCTGQADGPGCTGQAGGVVMQSYYQMREQPVWLLTL
eukprot:683542-Pelagomonas_calceolata.AAC.1